MRGWAIALRTADAVLRAAAKPRLAFALAALLGCGDDPIQIHKGDGTADYNRAELMAAVDAFVSAGRTVDAYATLAGEVRNLRPGMDATVAEIAELQMVMLAIGPIEQMQGRPRDEQVAKLALSVWAVALAPAIHVFAPDGWRDPRETMVAPKAGETPHAYVERLCGGPLAWDCEHVVPEWQGQVIGAEAINRLTARARIAVANCEECADPAWRAAVSRWEALDRKAIVDRRDAEAAGSPTRWPVAGAGAEPWPPIGAPPVELQADGDWIIAGETVAPPRRKAVLAELRPRAGEVLGVHALPNGRIDALEAAMATAAAAGFTQIAVEARGDDYPWPRQAYLLRAVKKPKRLTGADTVQVLLRSLDALAPPPPPSARRQ